MVWQQCDGNKYNDEGVKVKVKVIGLVRMVMFVITALVLMVVIKLMIMG